MKNNPPLTKKLSGDFSCFQWVSLSEIANFNHHMISCAPLPSLLSSLLPPFSSSLHSALSPLLSHSFSLLSNLSPALFAFSALLSLPASSPLVMTIPSSWRVLCGTGRHLGEPGLAGEMHIGLGPSTELAKKRWSPHDIFCVSIQNAKVSQWWFCVLGAIGKGSQW